MPYLALQNKNSKGGFHLSQIDHFAQDGNNSNVATVYHLLALCMGGIMSSYVAVPTKNN